MFQSIGVFPIFSNAVLHFEKHFDVMNGSSVLYAANGDGCDDMKILFFLESIIEHLNNENDTKMMILDTMIFKWSTYFF